MAGDRVRDRPLRRRWVHLLPDVDRDFKLITPGALLGAVTWFLTTWGFGEYAARLANYNITYGAMGVVVVLMTWFYLTGLVFLIGGEINQTRGEAQLFGRLLCEDPVPMAEVASKFGVSRERMRQVEQQLKQRIRDYLQNEMGDALGFPLIDATNVAMPRPKRPIVVPDL